MNKIIKLGITGIPNRQADSAKPTDSISRDHFIAKLDPVDLSQSIPPRTLVQLALNAVQTLNLDGLDPDRQGAVGPQSPMMLTLLGYCYAAGIYSSQQIAQAIQHDPMVRYICARSYPDERAIRQFRRSHRPLIKACLVSILQQTWTLKSQETEINTIDQETFEPELARHIEKSAQGRLEVATFVDMMDRDD